METGVRNYNILTSETKIVLKLEAYIPLKLSIYMLGQFETILGTEDLNLFPDHLF